LGFLVVFAAFFYILSTDPTIRYHHDHSLHKTCSHFERVTPNDCADPACKNDDELCPNDTICAPVAPSYFRVIETICVAIFAVDYLVRIVLVPQMPPRLAGVLDSDWDEDPAHANLPDPDYHPAKIFFLYIFSFMCIIDALTVGPFYAELFTRESTSFAVIRVIRLVRLYKLLKGTRFAASVEAFIITIRKSLLALSVLVLFTALGSIVFASIMYILECGEFTVNSDYPDGAYLRPGLTPGDSQPSPFVSIASALYWACVTVTTVGFGDIYPTTSTGRFFSMLWMFCGVLLIALPVSVLGSNFSTTLAEIEKRSGRKKHKNLVSNTLHKLKNSIVSSSPSIHSRFSENSGHLDKSLLTSEERNLRISDTSDNFSLPEIKRENKTLNPIQNNKSGDEDLISFDASNHTENSPSCCSVTCPNCSSTFLTSQSLPAENRLQYLSKQIDLFISELQKEKQKVLLMQSECDEAGNE
jgi:voltage-gated potassium channel Kch